MKRDKRADRCSAFSVKELSLYLAGAVSPHRQTRIQQHLLECVDCSRRLQELQSVCVLLQQAPEVVPPRNFTLPVRAARSYREVLWYPVLRSLTTIAAVLLLGLFGVSILQPVQQTPVAAQPTVALKPPPSVTQPHPTVMVAPVITRRAVPTASAGISGYPAPVESTPWIQATVSRPTTAPEQPSVQPAPEPVDWWPWQVMGMSLLGLFLGLTWVFYRRERGFFS